MTESPIVEAGMTDDERSELVDYLARHPRAGTLIKETGGLRKLRWARTGGGKSGGYRAIYYFHDETAPLYAILAYSKSNQSDLSPAGRKSASAMVEGIKLAIRKSKREVQPT